MKSNPSIGVITPTIGTPHLRACVESVLAQDYANITHYVVVDGPAHRQKVIDRLEGLLDRIQLVELPEPTGKDGYYGHRIYAAMPFLISTDLVAFLDEDNTFCPNHFSSLQALMAEHNLEWAYALRKIMSYSGEPICEDNCISLGIWGDWYGHQNLVDTSCYLLDRTLATQGSWIWNRKGYDDSVADPDKAFTRWLLSNRLRGFTTGQYTLNYRLSSSDKTAGPAYFAEGNKVMSSLYRYFPWQAPILEKIDDTLNYRRIVARHESARAEILARMGKADPLLEAANSEWVTAHA